MAKVLVTGGAGFIGSHLVDRLIGEDHEVTIFDSLDPQVHGKSQSLPVYLNSNAKFIQGNVCDVAALEDVLKGQEIVFHEAAQVGVGQSMYEISRYVEANTLGTANLLDLIVNKFRGDIKKLIVASSMSIYGEGLYRDSKGNNIFPFLRPDEQMAENKWEMLSQSGEVLKPARTPELKPLQSTSIYAITKKDQEEMTLSIGRSYGIPTVALRYFNVYGPRQSLSNPYTGVCAIFSSCLKNNNAPIIYEDGLQSRDFVSVHDIVEANILTMKKEEANFEAFNIGTGRATTILDVANVLSKLYGVSIEPKIENKFRSGDIRHCIADITKAKLKLGFEPKVSFDQGMEDLVAWGREVEAEDKAALAAQELETMGLVK